MSIGNSGRDHGPTFDASGKKFRSRAEIAGTLGPSGAPAIRVKGDGTYVDRSPRPARSPGPRAEYEWGDQTERASEESANAFRVEGDFRGLMLETRWAPGVAHVSTGSLPLEARLENQYVWPAKRELQTCQSSEWPRCNCVHDPSTEGGCAGARTASIASCTSSVPLDCCMGGAPDPSCTSTTASYREVRQGQG